MDESGGLTPKAVKELRKATDLALRATKHTTHALGSFRNIFLLDAPISQTGLFGEAILTHPLPSWLESAPCPGRRPPVGAAPHLIPLCPRSGKSAAVHCPTGDL